ncbi:MAG: T9SS type A sorting domain-containing protein, partial [Chitinophagaceae bacterium]
SLIRAEGGIFEIGGTINGNGVSLPKAGYIFYDGSNFKVNQINFSTDLTYLAFGWNDGFLFLAANTSNLDDFIISRLYGSNANGTLILDWVKSYSHPGLVVLPDNTTHDLVNGSSITESRIKVLGYILGSNPSENRYYIGDFDDLNGNIIKSEKYHLRVPFAPYFPQMGFDLFSSFGGPKFTGYAHRIGTSSADQNKFYYWGDFDEGCKEDVPLQELSASLSPNLRTDFQIFDVATISTSNFTVTVADESTTKTPVCIEPLNKYIGLAVDNKTRIFDTRPTGPFEDEGSTDGKITNRANYTTRGNKSIEVQSETTNVDISNILAIEVYSTGGQLIQKVTNPTLLYQLVKENRMQGLSSGLYFIRIVNKDNTITTIKKVLQ